MHLLFKTPEERFSCIEVQIILSSSVHLGRHYLEKLHSGYSM